MQRSERTGDHAHRVAQVALLLATVLPAQAEPEHWQRYEQLRRELAAAGSEGAAAGLWGGKTDAGLAWLHAFLTGAPDARVYRRWFAADAEPTLRLLHQSLWARPHTDRAEVLARDLQFVGALKDWGLFREAATLVEQGMLPWAADRPERFQLLLHTAEIHRRLYEWQHAGDALAAAALAAGDQSGAAVALAVQRAALYLARGVPDLAAPEIASAERTAVTPDQKAQALFVRLRLEHALDRPERAMAAVRTFEQAAVPPEVAADAAWHARRTQLRIRAALAALADPEVQSPDSAEAIAWLQAAIADPATAVDERLLARMVLASHRLDRAELAGVEEQLAAASAEQAAAASPSLDERRLAIATLGLRAARCAGDAATARQRASRLEQLWLELVGRWQEQPASRTGEGPLFFGDLRRAFVELLRSRLQPGAGGSEAALADVVRAQAAGSLAKEFSAGLPDLPAIRKALCPRDAGLLVYVPGHEASPVLAVDGRSVTMEVLPAGATGIDRRRQRLLSALQLARSGQPAACEAAARELAAILLPESLRPFLERWHSVAIVGLESLGYLPFELLPGPCGQPLGVTHAVSYLPSLPVGTWLAEHRPAAASALPRVRILACPDAQAAATAVEHPEPLPFGDAEAVLLRTAAAPARTEILRGAAAGRTALDAPAIDLLQILAHGVRDESRADPQGLLLGDGSVVWPSELAGATAARYWLVTACRAARGRLRRGDDGCHQLPGAALRAGARGVVAPVLDVGYRASLTFAADVQRGLFQEGLPLAESLRRARVAALARPDATACDAFLFHLVGLGDEPLAAPQQPTAHPMWLLAVLALLPIALLLRRRR